MTQTSNSRILPFIEYRMARRKKTMEKQCGCCLQKIPEEKLDEHLEKCHNDFQHKKR